VKLLFLSLAAGFLLGSIINAVGTGNPGPEVATITLWAIAAALIGIGIRP